MPLVAVQGLQATYSLDPSIQSRWQFSNTTGVQGSDVPEQVRSRTTKAERATVQDSEFRTHALIGSRSHH